MGINREYLGSFQNISKLFFQMTALAYFVNGQTEGRSKAILE